MLLSIALILLCGMSMSWICKKLKLPGLWECCSPVLFLGHMC